jgi:hypothetical protein
MDVMDMVRWILDPEWVLDISIYMMNAVVMVVGPIRRIREGGSEWEPIKILL